MSSLPKIPYYRITRLIQEGGTSAVYEGIDLRSGNVVAIKALFSNKAQDPFMLRRFKEEANHYLLLSHPNLPKLVDFVVDGNRMYLVMEFVKGIDMGKYLQANGPLDENKVVLFFTMILDTIGYLHQKGILHLDIKPSNIMITENMGIKVLDLGISALVSEGETIKKKCGSPSFMAPEQIRGEKLSYYTDIYQIGVTLFNMITGKLPFTGTTQQAIFDNVCKQPTPQIKDYLSTSLESVQTVIDKAMQKEGKDRYATCEEFEAALLESLSVTLEDESETEKRRKKEEECLNSKNMKIISVGRELDNDYVISNDPFVGRHHLQLIKDETGAYFVCDLNSTNGTFVNGKRIQGNVPIDEQDVIRIGNTTIPWISYFLTYAETEIESEKPKRRQRKRKTQEEIQARKQHRKEAMSGAGKWILRTLGVIATSLIMYGILYMLFWKNRHV